MANETASRYPTTDSQASTRSCDISISLGAYFCRCTLFAAFSSKPVNCGLWLSMPPTSSIARLSNPKGGWLPQHRPRCPVASSSSFARRCSSGPRGQVDFASMPCSIVSPHCALETRSSHGLVAHSGLELDAFCPWPFVQRLPVTRDCLPATPTSHPSHQAALANFDLSPAYQRQSHV